MVVQLKMFINEADLASVQYHVDAIRQYARAYNPYAGYVKYDFAGMRGKLSKRAKQEEPTSLFGEQVTLGSEQ